MMEFVNDKDFIEKNIKDLLVGMVEWVGDLFIYFEIWDVMS